MTFKQFYHYTLIGGMVVLPIVLILLPASFFDHGMEICPSRLFLDTNCPGCGMTRACMRIIHFDFSGAASFNKMAFIAFPILSYFYSLEWVRELNKVGLVKDEFLKKITIKLTNKKDEKA